MTGPSDGFHVDIDALRAAVSKLETQRENLDSLMRKARRGIKPGELVANDQTTSQARKAIEDVAIGHDGSLTMALRRLMDELNEKIGAYEATINQYQQDDAEAMPNQVPSEDRRA